MLTGNPRINGYLVPQPQYQGDGDGRWAWNANHLWFNGRAGRILRSLRYGGEITFGWSQLKTPAFNKIVAALAQETPVRFCPATRAARDPRDAEEKTYECEMTSPLPVYGAGDRARGVHSLSVTLETTAVRDVREGISTNALEYAFGFDQKVDLLGGIKGEEVVGTPAYTWRAHMPYPDRLIYVDARVGGSPTVRMLGKDGAQIGDDILLFGGEGYVELLEGTRHVEIEALPPRPSIYLDTDTFALTLESETDDTQTIGLHGIAGAEDASYDLSFRGETYTIQTTRLTPESVARNYVRHMGRARARIILDE